MCAEKAAVRLESIVVLMLGLLKTVLIEVFLSFNSKRK